MDGDDIKGKLFRLMTAAGDLLNGRGARGFHVSRQGTKVQANYLVGGDPEKLIHVEGDPERSSQTHANVLARLMDSYKVLIARRDFGIPMGSEESAVVNTFPLFEDGVDIPYDPRVLEDMLKQSFEGLR